MPVKRVVCSICQAEVNKAQTYHVGDGNRACKTHQGVTEKKESLEKNRNQEVQKALETAARKSERARRSILSESWSTSFRCLLDAGSASKPECGLKNSLPASLIEGAKAEQIYGTINPFDFRASRQ